MNIQTTSCSSSSTVTTEPKKIFRRKDQLYKIITHENGYPDRTAIDTYLYFNNWFKPKPDGTKTLKTKGVYFHYASLSKKLGCTKETLRLKIAKLEKLGLINRSFEHKHYVMCSSFNKAVVYVLKDTPHFENPHGISRFEFHLNPQTNHQYVKEKYGVVFGHNIKDVQAKKEALKTKKEAIKTSDLTLKKRDTNEHYSFLKEKKETKKDRSKKSTFLNSEIKKNSFIEKYTEPKTLEEFYPLKLEDCLELQKRSGREFNLNSMNEILLAMSQKPGIRARFNFKEGFMAYMAKAFMYEKRDAVAISDDGFKIKANRIRAAESYLQENKEDKKGAWLKTLPDNDWGKMRLKLGEELGFELEQLWFGRLEAEIDDSKKLIKLKAPNSFFLNWIINNYTSAMIVCEYYIEYSYELT